MQENDEAQLSILLIFFGYRGGMAQYSAQLANALAEHVQVTVIAPESDEIDELFDDRIGVYTLPRPDAADSKRGAIRALIVTSIRVNWYLIRHRPDVVHVPFLAGIPSILAVPCLWVHRIPIVATIHDPVSHQGQEIGIGLCTVDFRVVALRIATLAVDAIIVHGTECKQQAVAAGYPANKITVFPHGLYSHFEAADTGADPIIDDEHDDNNVLLFFGKIRPNKGFDRIPAIVDAVATEVDDVTALVAGTSDVGWQIDRAALERTVDSLRRHDRIELHDRYIPSDQVGRFFRSATAVVLPYYDATASGVAMTAYAFETPLVASHTGDMGRMIERDQTGLLADPEDTAELADKAIEVLTNDSLREQLTEHIHEQKEQYAWSTIAEQTITLYQNVS